MKKSAVIIVSLVLISSSLFSGCRKDPELTREQKRWISQMEEWYPDDEFTYTHHGVGFLGSFEENVIMLKSENFPDFTYEVYEKNGELYSYYPTEYHRAAIEAYYTDTLEDCFSVSDLEVGYKDHDYTARPCERISDEEFIEKYTTNELDIYLIFKRGDDYPSQDDIVSDILKYADSIGGDCDLSFYFCRSGKEHESDLLYRFVCGKGNIQCLLVYEGDPKKNDPEDIIRNMDLKDAMKEYAN